MKRPIPSFTVEVRRRQGRAERPAQAPKWFDTGPPEAGFRSDTLRAAAAAFEPREPPAPAPERLPEAPPPAPKGRVLPSLVEPIAPQSAEDEEAPASPTIDPHDGEARNGRAYRAKTSRRATSSPVRRPPIEVFMAVANAEPPPAPAPIEVFHPPVARAYSEPRPSPSPSIAIKPPARTPKKRSAAKPVVAERTLQAPPRDEPKLVVKAELPTPRANVEEPEEGRRKRKIMGRYVRKDELRPGEFWKKRLLKRR